MTAEIHNFSMSRRLHNARVAAGQAKRNELADYLRKMADYLQRDDIESEPSAITVVLSGKAGDEVLWNGYANNPDVSLRDVARAFDSQFSTPYKRRGGNFHDRRNL